MIGEDLDTYAQPVLFLHFDDPFSDASVVDLLSSFDESDTIKKTCSVSEVMDDFRAKEKTTLAIRDSDREDVIAAMQPGTMARDEIATIMVTTRASDLDGHQWFEFVVDLYQYCVDSGERPIHTIVTSDSGRYIVPPFTEESVLSGETVALGWIRILTPTQVDSLGRERLRSAPATRIEELANGSIAIGVTLGDDEEKDAVAAHLGIKPPLGDDWFDDLSHDIDYVRSRAARHLRSEAYSGTVSADRIIEQLDTDDASVRYKLTRGLRHLRDEAVEDVLYELATTDEDESVRSAAVGSLGTDEVARTALWDPSPRVQLSGLDELSECPDVETLERIVELLESEYFQTRQKAAERILADWFVDDLPTEAVESARLSLANCDDHEDKVVRRHAVEAAGRAKPTDLAERFVDSLDDEWSGVRIAAAQRFPDAGLETAPAVESLLDVIDAGGLSVPDAIEALIDIDPDTAIDAIIPRLHTLESEAKRTTIDGLDDLILDRSNVWVTIMLHAIDETDRRRAVETLREGSRGEHLQEALEDSLEYGFLGHVHHLFRE